MIADWSPYPNFSEAEMRCPVDRCGCGKCEVTPEFMTALQAVRTALGKPMNVTSGYRCPEYNERLGGGPEHPSGMAADIAVENPDAMEIVRIAVGVGFPRIGVAQRAGKPRFLHLGYSTTLPRAIWSY